MVNEPELRTGIIRPKVGRANEKLKKHFANIAGSVVVVPLIGF